MRKKIEKKNKNQKKRTKKQRSLDCLRLRVVCTYWLAQVNAFKNCNAARPRIRSFVAAPQRRLLRVNVHDASYHHFVVFIRTCSGCRGRIIVVVLRAF